ncbi:MAG TPA: mandelate racemase/muconate lactonizing enzyme family protein [Bryobacteraceae bacterium]|nr:mandelate racemase/muconate lactonizing enzyme family protein [Bryobacteraceae bacterium]
MSSLSRRGFLGAAASLAGFKALAQPERGRARIADIRTMVLQGPRTYTLVKVVSDAGVYGIGEGYGSPGVGIQAGVRELRPYFLGKDPLEIEALYNGLGNRIDGSAHMLLRAVSAIEIALWDLAGKLLNQPAATLLGGRYRERVRVYRDEGPTNMLDRASCNEWADKMNSDTAGWTAFRVTPPGTNGAPAAKLDRIRDPANRVLTSHELRDIRQAFEYCRDAIGWDRDLIVRCAGEYDLRTAMQLAEALDPVKPLWLEDPMPPDFSPGWVRLAQVSKVPIGTGENLARRQGFKDFIVNQGCDIVQLDIRNAGGLLESKKISSVAELFNLPMAAHSTGSALNTMATVQWAASVRDFLAGETAVGRRNWMDDTILHEGPLVAEGYIAVPRKPGLGVELNPDVVKANLAEGEKYWD